MRRRSQKTSASTKRLDPMIVVALIGLVGTIVAALLASPLLERLLEVRSTPTSIRLDASVTQTSPVLTPLQTSQTITGIPVASQLISLNQTVTGTLFGAEAGVWVFNEGPAAITVILDVGPFGGALIIVRDPSGVDRAYMDQQIRPGVTQLVNFLVPTEGDYTIWVRNTANEQADYTLTVQNALTPPPP